MNWIFEEFAKRLELNLSFFLELKEDSSRYTKSS